MLWIVLAILICMWIKKKTREDEKRFKKDMEEFERIRKLHEETMANINTKFDLSPEEKAKMNSNVEEMMRKWEALKASE